MILFGKSKVKSRPFGTFVSERVSKLTASEDGQFNAPIKVLRLL